MSANPPTPGKTRAKAGQPDLIAQALTYPWTTILDIGAGDGWVSRQFITEGKEPSATFLVDGVEIEGLTDLGPIPIDAMDGIADDSMDAIWAAHVLEHTHNTGLSLRHMHRILKPGGWLFLSVPPFKNRIVGGHVNTGWTLGQLAYVLAIHGFDARRGAFVRHGYNLAAFVAKGPIPDVPLRYDRDDLKRLAPWFPEKFPIRQADYGDVEAINWTWKVEPRHRDSLISRLKRRLLRRLSD